MGEPVYDFGNSLVTGIVAAAAVTASTAGTAVTVATCTTDHTYALVTNTLNQDVWLTYNGVRAWWIPAGLPTTIDLRGNNRALRASKIIGIYYDTAQPTAGKLAVTLD